MKSHNNVLGVLLEAVADYQKETNNSIKKTLNVVQYPDPAPRLYKVTVGHPTQKTCAFNVWAHSENDAWRRVFLYMDKEGLTGYFFNEPDSDQYIKIRNKVLYRENTGCEFFLAAKGISRSKVKYEDEIYDEFEPEYIGFADTICNYLNQQGWGNGTSIYVLKDNERWISYYASKKEAPCTEADVKAIQEDLELLEQMFPNKLIVEKIDKLQSVKDKPYFISILVKDI